MKFTPTNYTRLKLRLSRQYQRNLKSILKSLKATAPQSTLTQWVHAHRAYLTDFSSAKWYFLKQLHSYFSIAETLSKLSTLPAGFSKHDDDVFEKWNQSEFADVFLKTLNQGKSIQAATLVALNHFENHLVTLGSRQLLNEDKVHSAYRVQTSLGEFKKGKKIYRLIETTLHLEGKELDLMTRSFREMKEFSQRIEIALKVIKKFSPESWERFKAFTNVIIPIREKEFVSYSHQELPGYSMINLYDRDFVDIMDDLLHENGHHHLNYYLNLGKVIDEPQDNIYYSPWRRTLRPLRGIYHAYFTFFWAFKLFSSLARAKDMDSIFYLFGPKEKEKIYWRVLEEYFMLEYTYKDLKGARKQGLISDIGWDFVQEQKKEVSKFRKKIPLWEKKLTVHKSQLKDLKDTLKSAEKQYQKKRI